MDSLFLGVLCAWIVRQPRWQALLKKHRAALYSAVGVGALGYAAMSWTASPLDAPLLWTGGLSWLAVFYALILLAIVTGRPAGDLMRRVRRPLCLMGLCAYGMYLFHVPLLLRALHYLPPFLTAAVYIPALSFLSYAMRRGIEEPAIAYARRHWQYHPGGRPAISAARAARAGRAG